ncbi:MAG: AbrB/MazE/SpoVT family DNA-binding domain-containing protein [bacterium]
MYQLRVTMHDGEPAIVLPPEAVEKLGAVEGSHLFLIESPMGYLVTALDPIFADQMHAATEGLVKYRDALKELSE